MGKQRSIGLGIVFLMVVFLVVGLAGPALAAYGNETPPAAQPAQTGDPGAGAVVPHGGYSASTNYCLQCHEVHDATASFALLREASVTAVCQTCHGLFGSTTGDGPTTAYRTFAGTTPGTVSTQPAYTNGNPANSTSSTTGLPVDRDANVYGHAIGRRDSQGVTSNNRRGLDWEYDSWQWGAGEYVNSTVPDFIGTSSPSTGGLYCASCHTPHGADYGQAVNTESVARLQPDPSEGFRDVAVTTGNQIWWQNYTGADTIGVSAGEYGLVYLDTNAATTAAGGYQWEFCSSAALTTCINATVADADGDTSAWYGFKLLSRGPNHQYGIMPFTDSGPTTGAHRSYKSDEYNNDGAGWCGTCHDDKIDLSWSGTAHSHPTGCDACHGNPSTATTALQKDFPHSTTNQFLLQKFPDALCIQCHTELP